MEDLRAGSVDWTKLAHMLIEGQLVGVFDGDATLYGAHLLEDEIERRGMGWEYAQALLRLVAYPNGANLYDRTPRNGALYWETQPSDADLFPLIRATPEQRARAFLEAMKGAGE
jgi:hypothetical protein